jgi:hypothetical protein
MKFLDKKYRSIFSLLQVGVASISIFLFYILIKNHFGLEYLGYFSLISGFLSFLTIFGTQISGNLLHAIPMYKKNEDISSYFSNSFLLNVLISICLFGVFYFLQGFVKNWFHFDVDISRYFFFIVIIGTLSILNNTFIFFNDSINKIIQRNLISITSNFLLVPIFLVLLNFIEGFSAVLYALAIQQFIQFSLFIYFYLKEFKFIFGKLIISLDFQLREGYFVNNLLIVLADLFTKIFVSRFLGFKDLGTYELISKIFIQFKTAVSVILYPKMIDIIRIDKGEICDKNLRIKMVVRSMRDNSQGIILVLNLFLYFTVLIVYFMPYVFGMISVDSRGLYIIFYSFLFSHLSISMLPVYFLFQGLGKIGTLNHYHLTYLLTLLFFYITFRAFQEVNIHTFGLMLNGSLFVSSLILYVHAKFKYTYKIGDLFFLNHFKGSYFLITLIFSILILNFHYCLSYLFSMAILGVIFIAVWVVINFKKVKAVAFNL